jgi:putative transposase
MKTNEIYHVYNRGNNCQPIFFERENYFYFLKKTKQFLCPNCDILGYSLMPNHFHFLIWANERSTKVYRPRCKKYRNAIHKKPKIQMTYFSRGLKNLLSSYARGINKRFDRTGSLFQQNTKSKRTSSEFFTQDYSLWCFNYIHNNPTVCGMVNSPEEYEFSSYRDYLENNVNSLCNLTLGRQVLSLQENNLIDFNTVEVPPNILKKIF